MRERDKVHPALHRGVHVGQLRGVVASEQQRELRGEREEVLTHEAGLDGVATSQAFQLCFVPASALLGFGRRNKARADQPGQVGGVTVIGRCDEYVHGRNLSILAHNGRQAVQEQRLAVAALAIEEGDHVFAV